MTQPIYRGWTREKLDEQLNLRARLPEHAEFFERWARDSRTVRERTTALVDLAYGESPGERLDLFPAAGRDKAPLVAFIHGGYWQSLDKSDFSYLAPAFLERGIAFASLNYDLAPKADIATMVAQIRAAVAWLYRRAGERGIDRERIFVAGHSAGGHLAVTALDRAWPQKEGLPPDLVKGALSISGIYDLEPIRLSYHQAVMRIDEEQVAAYSPLRALPQAAGPLLAGVGSEETEEFLLQQRELLDVWRSAGLTGSRVELPGRHHFDAVDALGEPDHPLFAALHAMVHADPGPTAA
ncbi:alpha/beta hydrolase [Ferruginivarius sediminum]|uniref:Alpha/beta hydrolase n=1 Tax=Ferruginivarius sediminum TaxID=2661937 RepID=A0A369TEG9_9PROT|nr:alpha/beta hydrolase [Ferruginivarius sediminum]RDD63242.1 alpha/beta hydrolase [Ferruginivarius sediminum]